MSGAKHDYWNTTKEQYDWMEARIRDLEAAGNDLRASLVGMCSIADVMPDSCAARIKRFDDLFETPAETNRCGPDCYGDDCTTETSGDA